MSRPGTGPTGATPAGPAGPLSYWGWSPQNQRMEMMDLSSYLDSFRQGYDTALQDLSSRVQSLTNALGAMTPATAGAPSMYGGPGTATPQAWHAPQHATHHGRHHGHHHDDDDCGWGHHHEHGCECEEGGHECGCEHDCRCECCIVDADIVVYAHCGEVRVVQIEIENETRKAREDVTIEMSEVRSSSGRKLPWQTILRPNGPLTLEPCSTTKLELLVHIQCGELKPVPAPAGRATAKSTETAGLLAAIAEGRAESSDVDDCEVGYLTIRLGGCITRPIVVAIAVLPLSCGSYRAGCSCSCCC